MSHYIDCTIDTEPMARELKSVSKHVDMTTAAVVSMQAAVVAADKEAADLVCDHVNRGFHTMMRSQVSQKIAKLQSDVDSHILRLNQLTKQLLSIKSRMERDYQRTAQRYSRLFGTLNKELRKRVQELDQPVFKFATMEVQTNSNRMNQLTATGAIMQNEAITDAQRILASNVKYHSAQVVENSRRFVADMTEQKLLTDRILLSNQGSREACMMLPIVVSECSNAPDTAVVDVYVSSSMLKEGNQSTVKGEVFQKVTELPWRSTPISSEVKNEFSRLTANSSLSPRVKDTLTRLMQQTTEYQSL